MSRRPLSFLAAIAPALAGCAVATLLYGLAYLHNPSHPHVGGDAGWFSGFDQGRTLEAARAWAAGDLDARRQWYMPGYPLLAAPLIGWLGPHAFGVVDLACLLAALVVFGELAGELFARPGRNRARWLGVACFLATTLMTRRESDLWVVPWSTTPTAALILAALLATARFVRLREARAVAAAAFCACLTPAFRPTDLLPACSGPALACILALALRRDARETARVVAAALGGAALALALTAAIYLPVFGPQRSAYLAYSAQVGLDAGLIASHWVSLFIDPRPLFTDGTGLIVAFPWIASGLCGLAAAVLLGRRRLAHLAVLGSVGTYLLIYLAYRDLNPPGLWRYGNVHYFKWLLPVLGLYTLVLAGLLVRRPLATAWLTLGVAAALLPWRVRLVDIAPLPTQRPDPHTLVFNADLRSVADSLTVPADGAWGSIYFGGVRDTPTGRLAQTTGFRLVPRDGGFTLMPMRPAGRGRMTLYVPSDVRLDDGPAFAARQHISWGLPCWLIATGACTPQPILPPPALPPDGIIAFDGSDTRYLRGGWSPPERTGQWTDGDTADLAFAAHGRLVLTLRGHAYVPPGAPALDLVVSVNGRDLATRRLETMDSVAIALPVVVADGRVALTLHMNARSPAVLEPPSADRRALGLFVESLSVTSAHEAAGRAR